MRAGWRSWRKKGLAMGELWDLPSRMVKEWEAETKFVFLIAFYGEEQIISVKTTKRGWDVPGGHIEAGETPKEAIVRETWEEAKIELLGDPWAFVKVPYHGTFAKGFLSEAYYLSPNFVPTPETEERAVMKIKEFIPLYQGDKEQALKIISLAKRLAYKRDHR